MSQAAVLPERLLGVPDLCQLFKVEPRTISVWIRVGRIPRPIKIGMRCHWRPESIAQLLVHAEHPVEA